MNRRERQRLFVVAVVVVAAVIAAISSAGGGDEQRTRRQPAAGASSAVVSGSPAQRRRAHVHDEDARRGPDHTLQQRIARRFIRVFSRYQAGRSGSITTRQLRELATPELADYLLAQAPRGAPRSARRVRVVRLDVTGPAGGPVKAAALLAYPRGRSSLFELRIDRDGARWRVSELYPSAG